MKPLTAGLESNFSKVKFSQIGKHGNFKYDKWRSFSAAIGYMLNLLMKIIKKNHKIKIKNMFDNGDYKVYSRSRKNFLKSNNHKMGKNTKKGVIMEDLQENTKEEVIMEDLQENTKEEIGELYEIVLNTREQCEMIEQCVKNQIDVKDKMIDKLYKELEYYKQESADNFIEQFLKAFIKIHKDMKRLYNGDGFKNMNADELRREWKYILEDITDLFEQQDMDAYNSESGDVFDPAIHQPKIEYTDDITLDKKIKASISDGYKRKNKIIIPERVIVYQFKEF